MPVGFKEKRGRLGTFARQTSDSSADANASAPKNGPNTQKQPEAPQLRSEEAARRELAEAARLPVPPVPRHGHAAVSDHPASGPLASQQKPQTSPLMAQMSPTRHRTSDHLDDGHGDLFCGSQLGENFMQSGLSTPQNEPEELDEEPTPTSRRTSIRPIQQYSKGSDRLFQDTDTAKFLMGDDCTLSVVDAGPKRRALPLLMDGFRDDGGIDEGNHSSKVAVDRKYHLPQAALQPALPVRQVLVKNRPVRGQRTTHTTREFGSPSPSVKDASRQVKRTGNRPRHEVADHFSDEETGSVTGHEEPRIASNVPNARDSGHFHAGGFKHANVAHHRLPQDRKRRRGSPDYDDKMLSCMTYQDLQNESFDMEPARIAGQNAHDAFSKLPLKLEQYRQQAAKEQRHMFSAMSMEDWENAGDWFVDQFTDIMKRLRDARRGKRRMIQGFENEAAAREEAVRLRSETIDRKLTKMRQDGQRVVEDKIM